MNEEKKDILDFFFDGDIIIAGAQGYTNISKILETENYMFAINDCDSDLNVFFMYNPQNEMFDNRKTKRCIFKTKRIFSVSPPLQK